MQGLSMSFSLPFCLLLCICGFSQSVITGKVQDEKGKPLSAASIFLSGTSFGTIATEDGRFTLNSIPSGTFELVVSSVGYQTISTQINTRQTKQPLTIILREKADELEGVTIRPGYDVSWEEWGKFFTDNFIGTMPGATDCIIENPEVMKFRHYEKEQVLKVWAKKPLIISNKYLGYNISYQLESFEYDFASKVVYFLGYPLYKEMSTTRERRRREWEDNRAQAYFGSSLHFFRSLYRNTVQEEGFEMRRLVKRPNEEKERVKNMVRKNFLNGGSIRFSSEAMNVSDSSGGGTDSTAYYSRVLSQPNEIDLLYNDILPGDSVAFQVNSYTAGMEFTDYLHITYVKGKEHPRYASEQMRADKKPGLQISTIRMTGPGPLEIGSSGQLNDPLLILFSGYWGWKDKIAMMLPYDYTLSK